VSDVEQYEQAARRYPTVILVDRRLLEGNRSIFENERPHDEKGAEQSRIDPVMPV
jgi:hypothetical protein